MTSPRSHPFPLPYILSRHPSSSLSRRCRQRDNRSRSFVIFINSTIRALNYLHDKNNFKPSQQSNNNITNMQSRIHSHLINQCRRFYRDNHHPSTSTDGRRPAQVYVSDTNTINQLTKSFMESFNSYQFSTYPYFNEHTNSFNNSYISSSMETFAHSIIDGEPRSHIFDYSAAMKPSAVPLIANRVALPSSLHSVPMLSVLPKSMRDYYNQTNTELFRSSDVEHRPAHAFASNSEYTALLKRMKAVGMINFTSTPRCVNGCFGVPKPDGEIRLVIDAQPANALFCLPPHVDLPTPSHT
jgi:hypothetical protein